MLEAVCNRDRIVLKTTLSKVKLLTETITLYLQSRKGYTGNLKKYINRLSIMTDRAEFLCNIKNTKD